MSKNESFAPQEVHPVGQTEAPKPPSLLPEPGGERQTLNLLRQMNHQQKQLDQKYGLPEDPLAKGPMDNMPHPPTDARYKASDADAHTIAEMLKDGKISADEKKKITEIVLKGLDNHSLGDLTAKVNKELKAAGSTNELHIDDSMAKVKDMGKVTVSVCDANSHSCFDGFVIPINNTPQVSMPPGRDGIKR